MESFNLNEFLIQLVILAGMVSAIGGAVAVIKKWIKDSKQNRHDEMLRSHDDKISKLEERITILESKNNKQDKFASAMCGAMIALLEHNINGNSIEKLKEAKEEIQDFLIYRG